MMKKNTGPSEFKHLAGIEYFNFEEDFMEDNVRCIPMIVRFKLDAVGVKLKLGEWGRFSADERVLLALKPIASLNERDEYYVYLTGLIERRTRNQATLMAVEMMPAWRKLTQLPAVLEEKIEEEGMSMSLDQWMGLTDIKRFALLKLCRPGHENKNFPKAMVEFGLID